MIPEEFIRQSDNTRKAVKTIGFIPREPSRAAAALQASGRKIKSSCQFAQGQARSLHQPIDDCRGKAFPDCFTQIAISSEGAPENLFPAQFAHDGFQLVDHSVVNYSVK